MICKRQSGEYFCYDCDCEICKDCSQLHSGMKYFQSHHITSKSDFKEHPIYVNFRCDSHDELIHLFCEHHDVVLCAECVPSHTGCRMISIPSSQDKRVYYIQDIEKHITDFLSYLQMVSAHAGQALVEISTSKETLKKQFKERMKEMINILSSIEEDVFQNNENLEKMISQIIKETEMRADIIKDLETKIAWVKQRSHKEQFILALNLRRTILDNISNIKSMVDKSKCTVISSIRPLDISIMKGAFIDFTVAPLMEINCFETKPRNSMNIKLKPLKQIQVTKDVIPNFINGAVIISGKEIALSDFANERIIFVSLAEDKQQTLPLGYRPADLTTYGSGGKIAVSLTDHQAISLIDRQNSKIEKLKFKDTGCLAGASFYDEKLAIRVLGYGLYILDLSGNISSKISVPWLDYNMQRIAYINNKIYISKWDANKVYCLTTSGKLLWEFHNDKIIKAPTGIAVDEAENVYVTGLYSNNVVVISDNGRLCMELIKDIEELQQPFAIDYNHKEQKLLVCSSSGLCLLYSISH